jgi:hypothetical protein
MENVQLNVYIYLEVDATDDICHAMCFLNEFCS